VTATTDLRDKAADGPLEALTGLTPRETLDFFQIGVCALDLDSGAITYDAVAAEMLGYPPAQRTFSRDEYREIVHPEDMAHMTANIAERMGSPRPLETHVRLRRLDGGYRWFSFRSRGVADEDGRIAQSYGVLADIDAFKRAELARDELENQLEAAACAARIGLWNWEAATGEGVWSAKCAEILGLPADAPFDVAALIERVHDDDRARTLDDIEAVTRRGADRFSSRFRYLREDGRTIWIESEGRAAQAPDGPVKIFGSLRDVTRDKEQALALERAKTAAEEAAEAKANFLATISHEIRTPLNAVIGMSGLLVKADLSPAAREYAETAKAAGEHLLCLVNDILDLTKLDANRVELDDVVFDLGDEIGRVIDMARPGAARKGLPIRLDVSTDAAGDYRGDPARFRQILLNLLANAVKFTERGEIRVSAESVDRGLKVSVADTGIGIDASARARLFDDFVQADAGINRRYGGTGLGLAICRRLVRLMGGDIGVDSEPGLGSTFWFFAPLERAGLEAAGDGEAACAGPLRILAADDNPANRLLIGSVLRELGCAVDLVEDGEAALRAAGDAAFDVIVLDIQMPGMGGVAAARSLRKAAGPNATTPLLALTAHAERRSELLEAGFDDVVGKPFSVGGLAATLNSLMQKDPETTCQTRSTIRS